MKPYDLVTSRVPLPWRLYPFQEHAVNELAPIEKVGLYFDTGTGKTPTSIVSCLYKLVMGEVKRVLCIVPPVLITNWCRNLAKVPGATYVAYRGTPKQRAKINLDAQFVVLSYQVFKNDIDYLRDVFADETLAVVCDEAQAIKNVGTDNFEKVRDFSVGNHVILLTGTPLSSPEDAYAYTRFTAPSVYRNLNQFYNVHVAKLDFFDKPVEWTNLDLLKENLMINAIRVLKEDVLKDLPEVTYTELDYDLSPAHLRLYNKLADEQIALLADGNKIDLTNATALFNALQQIPANAEHFSAGEIESTILDLIDEIMDELGDKKLVIFTTYRMTTKRLTEHGAKYQAVSIWGDISASQKQRNIDRFVEDAQCRMIVMNWQAGGAGIDSLQHVCSDMLFVELPYRAAPFQQAVARLHRSGQHMPVNVRIALAVNTIQWAIYQMVLDNDSLINCCVRGVDDLKLLVKGKRSA